MLNTQYQSIGYYWYVYLISLAAGPGAGLSERQRARLSEARRRLSSPTRQVWSAGERLERRQAVKSGGAGPNTRERAPE